LQNLKGKLQATEVNESADCSVKIGLLILTVILPIFLNGIGSA
jgi:hypothetical protein